VSYVSAAAQILVEILRERPMRTIQREAIRHCWYERFPHQDVTDRQSEYSHARYRRRTFLGEKPHHRGYSTGRKGKDYLRRALQQLDAEGVLTRTESSVTVVDVARLVEIANGAPLERGLACGDE
jgi:hypothetical protein